MIVNHFALVIQNKMFESGIPTKIVIIKISIVINVAYLYISLESNQDLLLCIIAENGEAAGVIVPNRTTKMNIAIIGAGIIPID